MCYIISMNKDLCKEKISWYKLLFTLMSTALVACIGWIVSNTNYSLKVVILLNGISIIAIAMVFAFGSLFFGIFLEPEKATSKK